MTLHQKLDTILQNVVINVDGIELVTSKVSTGSMSYAFTDNYACVIISGSCGSIMTNASSFIMQYTGKGSSKMLSNYAYIKNGTDSSIRNVAFILTNVIAGETVTLTDTGRGCCNLLVLKVG